MPDTLNLPGDLTPESTPASTPETTTESTAPEPEAVAEGAAAAVVAPESADAAAVEPAPPAIPELSPAACAARLAELFPALFTPGAAKPLKLRIQADIQQRAPGIFTKKTLSIFLHRHTTSTAYLRALVASPQRVDLDGQPAGEVAEEHRAAATTELERRRALHDERRAAEREAQRKMYAARRQAEAAQRPPPGAHRPPDAQASPPGAPADGSPPRSPGPTDDRPPRPARPPRHAQGDSRRATAGPRSANAAPNAPQRSSERPPQRPPQRPPRDARDEQRAATAAPAHLLDEVSASPPTADDEARRERAALLRAYESSTLTRANFCVLKRMSEAQLEELLVQARLEAPRREPPPPRPAAPGPRPAMDASHQRRGPRR